MEGPAPKRGEIKTLTGIRGVAACYVMLFHFGAGSGAGHLKAFILHGFLAVDLFFILSGFVMALTYAKSFVTPPSIYKYINFLWNRIGRIYPLYLFITLLTLTLAHFPWAALPIPSSSTLIFNLLLCQAWGFAESIGGPSWSISTEFAAYLLFPLVAGKIISGNRSWKLAAMIFGVAVLVLVSTRTNLQLHEVIAGQAMRSGPMDVWGIGTVYPLIRCLGGFTLGMLAYSVTTALPRVRRLHLGLLTDATAVLILLLLAVKNSDVILVLLFVPFVLLLSMQEGITARITQNTIVYWLGTISYSVYLIHRLVHKLLRTPIRNYLEAHHISHAPALAGVFLVGIVIVLSSITYYGLEKPARDWLRSLRSGRVPRIEAEPAAP